METGIGSGKTTVYPFAKFTRVCHATGCLVTRTAWRRGSRLLAKTAGTPLQVRSKRGIGQCP
jgi:hypothetical protein